MKPAPFDYLRAESLAEVHAVLASEGSDAAVIAGGQTLVPLLSMRMARPNLLLDIMHVEELGGIRRERIHRGPGHVAADEEMLDRRDPCLKAFERHLEILRPHGSHDHALLGTVGGASREDPGQGAQGPEEISS